MVHVRIRHVQPLNPVIAWTVAGVLAIGCVSVGGVTDAARRLGIDPAAIVDVEGSAMAPIIGPDGTVSVVAIVHREGAWVASPLTASRGTTGTDSLHLFTYGGETGAAWNSLVYGSAAPGTERVELAGFPDQRGGRVVAGAWIIALQDKDLAPEDLEWRFIAEDGTVRTGTGIFPPDA